MKATGKIKNVVIDTTTNKPIVTIEINEKQEVFCNIEKLANADSIDIDIKTHRKRRSLSANAYAWVLLDRLAETLSTSKEKIYREIIKNIGGNSTYVKVRKEAAQKLIEHWSENGLGWCGEIIDTVDDFCEVVLYYG